MALWQGKSKRKPTGGRRSPHSSKKRYEIGREVQGVTHETLNSEIAASDEGASVCIIKLRT